MKSLLLSFGIFLFTFNCLLAQAPQKFNYQAVPRLSNGNLLPGQSVKVRFVITEDGPDVVRYAEEQTVSTSQHGVLSAAIGEGGVTGGLPHNFAGIDWAQHQYYLGVSLDLDGNGSFDTGENFSNTQLLSVPYAMYAQKSGDPGTTDNDTDPTNEFQQLSLSGNVISLSNGGGSVTMPDISPTNEIQQLSLNGNVLSLSNGGGAVTLSGADAQTLSIAGNTLSISNGNSVTLPAGGADAQTLSVAGNTLSISNGNSVALPAEVDGSVTNEIQQLSLAGSTVSLSNGGGSVTLPDASATNELQSLSIAGNVISLSDGGSITLPPNQGTDAQTLTVTGNTLSISNGNSVDLPAEVDGSVTNEIQQISLTGSTVSLSNGGGSVTLPDASATNELQSLSIAGNVISLSDGGSITLPPNQGTDAQTLTVAGNTLSISNGNSVDLPAEVDGSVTNEIQQITLAGSTVSLSNGGGSVTLPDASATNELQSLSIAGNVISLSDGGAVTLPAEGDGSPTNELQALTLNGNQLSLSQGGGTVTLPNTGGNSLVAGVGINISTVLNTSTISAQTDNPIWNAGLLRGRPIGGMPPNPGYVMAYQNDTDGWVSLPNDLTIEGGSLQVSALRGRPIGGMPPNPGYIMAYQDDTDGWVSLPNDLTIDNGKLVVAKIQGRSVSMDGAGPGMLLTCVDDGNGGLAFQCLPPSGGSGGLPINYTGNSSTPLINIGNTNNGNAPSVAVYTSGRYGIYGVTAKGDPLPIDFADYLDRSFTYPAGIFGYDSNTSQEGAGVYGSSVSALGAGGSGVGVGGFFQGGWIGAVGVGYEDGHAGLAGIKKAKIADANWPKEQQWGVYGESTHDNYAYAGYFMGDVKISDDLFVEGTLIKSSGSFRIDHPLDPANKYLYHSFVESPDMKNIYDGVVTTDADGFAIVELPEYFQVLNKDFRYQLTCIGTFAQAIISKKVENNRFQIQTDKPGVEVSWQVTGIRKDPYAEAHRIQTEVDKTGYEKGKYTHPELYGQPDSLKIARKAERLPR
jgi:hypothetical protein